MDQRNAGRSTAPIRARDGWDSYTADQAALLDHLGIERCHVLGACIGCSYAFGVHENRDAFYQMFDGWAANMKQRQDGLDDDSLAPFRESMYGGEFVFNVNRDFVRGLDTPLLVLAGNDLYHPAPVAREIVQLAPNAELVESWKDADAVVPTIERVRGFLAANTPVAA